MGDPSYKSKPINISKASLRNLLVACGLPPFTLVSCGLKRFNLSHHIQYGEDSSQDPVSLVLLLRIPRNSQSISISMRIRLADLATVTFLTSMNEETAQNIQRKCIERRNLLAKHPLYFLTLIYEDRCFEYKSWFDDILHEINVVESATGMTRNTWKMQLSPRLREWFSDYDNLLRMLYASNTELSHFDTVTTFSVKFGDFLLAALKMLDELRVEVGFAPLPKREYRCLHERIAFTRSRCDLTADKTREMLERVKGQINVVRHGTMPRAATMWALFCKGYLYMQRHIELRHRFSDQILHRLLTLSHRETARSTSPWQRTPTTSQRLLHGTARQ